MSSGTNGGGSITGLWRYPIKSMQGEEINAAEVTERGLLGDRGYALVDPSNDKVVSAKNPRKWGNLFNFSAAYVESPTLGRPLPAVRITLPDGKRISSHQPDVDTQFSTVLGREVCLAAIAPENPTLEEYWPNIEGLSQRDTVTEEAMPPGTFFDLAVVHVLTSATINRLSELYPQGHFDVRRFRPNIVIDAPGGTNDFLENSWIGHTLAIGESVRLRISGACPRCVMTTLPQGDLPRDHGILRAAAQHNEANVGVYATVVQGGTICEGDAVRIE